MQKLKVKDTVIVLSGKSKGKIGEVVKILKKTNRVIVKDVNMVSKAKKQTNETDDAGFKQVEASIHLSNVSVYSSKLSAPSRIRIERSENGVDRFLKLCGTKL